MDSEREFGELKATVAAQGRAFEDFRAEVRQWRMELAELTRERLDNHSKRIRQLERWQAWLGGLGLAIGAAITWLLGLARGSK